MTTTEAILSIELKYCLDTQHFTSCIALSFIEDVNSCEDMTDEQLLKYFDKEAEALKDATRLEGLHEFLECKLMMNMDNQNARWYIQGLFVNNHSFLSQNGVKGIIKESQKLAVTYVLSDISLQCLRKRLESSLTFSHHSLKKDFKEFLKHTVKLSEAIQFVDYDPKKRSKKTDDKRSGNPNRTQPGKEKDKKCEVLLCLWEPH